MVTQAALDKFAHSRQALLDTIQGLGQAELTQVAVEGTWTIQDILSHLVAWENLILKPLQSLNRGEPFAAESIPDHISWNEEQAAQRKALPFRAVLDEMAATRQAILAEAVKLTPEQWELKFAMPWGGESTLAEMFAGLAWHEREHLHTLKTWLKERTS